MATSDRHSGTLRTDYEADRARVDDLRPLNADTDKLLHRLIQANREMPYRDADGREGTLTPFLENHVLTVLADIRRKRLAGYGSSFAEAQGTAGQSRYARKLEKDIRNWKARLEAYLQGALVTGTQDSPSAAVARELLDRLESSLQGTADGANRRYYRMLRTVTVIQENIGSYLNRVKESGDTDPALALLIAYVKNYAGIAEAFNQKFATLPELYRREVLHAVPREATPDNAYLVVTPAGGGFTLEAGTAFSAGEELVYKTPQKEYISPMRPVSAQAVCKDKSGLHLQTLDFENTDTAETLFIGGKELQTGWQIESPMLVLEEGRREVTVRFLLKQGETQPADGKRQGFVLQYATADGWAEPHAECELSGGSLTFCFTLGREASAPVPCTTDLHGTETACPALRILTVNENYPDWAEGLAFEAVRITVEVSGIRNFTLCNELGEADTTQPFQPFGIQGERGAWFLFGNGEMGLKPLQQATLKGKWKGLPESRAEFDGLYREYGADADAFTVATDYRQDGEWKQCGKGQKLFHFDTDTDGLLANIIIPFGDGINSSNASDYNKDGFFRVTLESPSTGFGTEAYRKRFMEVMIHNSRCKEKHHKEIPQEPSVPLLADAELSYTATARTGQTDRNSPIIRLERITALPEQMQYATDGDGAFPFLLSAPAEHLLYFAFACAEGEKTVRMYIDMALPRERIPFGSPQPDRHVQASWELWNGTGWQSVPSESVKVEETCGLTRSGFVEITLPGKIDGRHIDGQGRMWLRAALTGDVSACLAIRNVWTNCIRLAAQDGNGLPLPAGTIQGMEEADGRIGSIVQPLPGFGGRPAETETQSAVRQSARIHNRHRALTIKDYEQLVLEHFPEVDKVQCIPVPRDKGASEICLVVFSRAEDSRYYLSQAWKLAEIQRLIRQQYTSPFVSLQVINPVYERVKVHCRAVLWDSVQDEDKAIRQLVVLAQNYIAPWYRKKEIPKLCQSYSYKELHARMANHEDLMKLVALEVDMEHLPHTDINEKNPIFKGSHPWSVLLPEIRIELLSPHDGIDEAEIGGNFIIG